MNNKINTFFSLSLFSVVILNSMTNAWANKEKKIVIPASHLFHLTADGGNGGDGGSGSAGGNGGNGGNGGDGGKHLIR